MRRRSLLLEFDLGPGCMLVPPVEVRRMLNMATSIADGTDVWAVVQASPPMRLTIRACLDDHCRECSLPFYRCEFEGGQMQAISG